MAAEDYIDDLYLAMDEYYERREHDEAVEDDRLSAMFAKALKRTSQAALAAQPDGESAVPLLCGAPVVST